MQKNYFFKICVAANALLGLRKSNLNLQITITWIIGNFRDIVFKMLVDNVTVGTPVSC